MKHPYRLFYDGACPMCCREVAWLKRRDRKGNLQTEDISSDQFDASRYGLDEKEINRLLHGITSDGSVLKGVDAVRQAYRTVGLGWLVAPTRLPGVNALCKLFYRWFARNRLTLGRLLGRKCRDGQCSVVTENNSNHG